MHSRVSEATSDRPDDFEALKEAALRGVKGRHRQHTVVLPSPQVGLVGGWAGVQLAWVVLVKQARRLHVRHVCALMAFQPGMLSTAAAASSPEPSELSGWQLEHAF